MHLNRSRLNRFALVALPILACLGNDQARAAAPANDDYASSLELLTSVPSTSTNANATLETGESIPDGYSTTNYQATVWWRWTPSLPGWYEITTADSDINTVLSVWTGPGTDFSTPQTLVHLNNEAAEGKVSRIQFFADDATVYKIAIAGRTAADRGAVSLRAFVIPDPFAQVRAVQFSPASVNVSNAPAHAAATLTIESSRELQSAHFKLYDATGLLVLDAPFDSADRISGNVASGEYRVAFTVPRYVAPGSYFWKLSLSHTTLDKTSSGGWEGCTPLSAGITRTFNVNNTGTVDAYALWIARSRGDVWPEVPVPLGTAAIQNLPESLSIEKFAFGLAAGQKTPQFVGVDGGTLLQSGLPSIEALADDAGAPRLRVQFVRRLNAAAQGLGYTVQFSNDLVTWENAASAPQWLATDGTFEALSVEDSLTGKDTPARFARILVERTLP